MLSGNLRKWLLVLAVLILAALLIAPSGSRRLSAQTVAFTPTYQVSTRLYANVLPGSEIRTFGFFLALERARSPWVPHLWVQRYRNRMYARLAGEVEG